MMGFSIGGIVCVREVLIIWAFGCKGVIIDAILLLKNGI